ncbi:MAG TPA: HD domain-containing phosphohydrolase [Longimicrobium sp.]|jgi:putative two-component system response regulator
MVTLTPTTPLLGAVDGRPRVLLVDDEAGIRQVLRQLLAGEPYEVLEAPDGAAALQLFAERGADVVLTDLMMPGISGIDLLKSVKAMDDTVAVILLTGAGTMENAIAALRLSADDYLLKPFNIDQVLHALSRAVEHRRLLLENRYYQSRLEQRVREQADQIEQMFLDGLLTIANAVEARDRYTRGHVERVTIYAVATGAELGLGEEELRALAVSGLLHDVGKIGIPDHLLTKPGTLTPEEYAVMKQHPLIGAAIVERSSSLREAVPGILHHHERWDGAGYPFGLAGEAISTAGRIVSVVDTFDAIVSSRPYRAERPEPVALEELRRCAGTQFDPRVVDAFLRAFGEGFKGGAELSCIQALRLHDAARPDQSLPERLRAVPLLN